MRIPVIGLVALLIGGGVAPLLAMNNADIIKMKEADFSEDTILLSIAKEPANYDTSPDGLIALKKAGISERVIQRLMALQRGETSEPAAPPAPITTTASPPVAAEAVVASEPPRSTFFAMDFPSIAPPVVDPVAGKEYFLRSTLFFEDGKHVATNYSRGVPVPINTAVRVDSISGKTIALHRVDTGESLKVENVDKYTRKGIVELARTLLSDVKTPIEQLPPEAATAIQHGELRKGMTKEIVLMTRGYPPAHETPSLDSNRWVYWTSRFVKLTIVFDDRGRLSEGRGLY